MTTSDRWNADAEDPCTGPRHLKVRLCPCRTNERQRNVRHPRAVGLTPDDPGGARPAASTRGPAPRADRRGRSRHPFSSSADPAAAPSHPRQRRCPGPRTPPGSPRGRGVVAVGVRGIVRKPAPRHRRRTPAPAAGAVHAAAEAVAVGVGPVVEEARRRRRRRRSAPSQSSSTPLQISTAPGWTAASASSQSPLVGDQCRRARTQAPTGAAASPKPSPSTSAYQVRRVEPPSSIDAVAVVVDAVAELVARRGSRRRRRRRSRRRPATWPARGVQATHGAGVAAEAVAVGVRVPGRGAGRRRRSPPSQSSSTPLQTSAARG